MIKKDADTGWIIYKRGKRWNNEIYDTFKKAKDENTCFLNLPYKLEIKQVKITVIGSYRRKILNT
jgi:hypothetical protein